VIVGADPEWLVEHPYQAVLAVLSGQAVTEVTAQFGASRHTV